MRDANRKSPWVWVAVAGVAFVGLVAFAVVRLQALPEGPQPVAWDKEPCGHCRMHVSEPPFAAQLITTDGRVFHYDDPGCLFRHVVAERPPVHQTWFHDHEADRWIDGNSARFVEVEMSPMGYLRGAVDASAPGADKGLTLSQAIDAVEQLPPERR